MLVATKLGRTVLAEGLGMAACAQHESAVLAGLLESFSEAIVRDAMKVAVTRIATVAQFRQYLWLRNVIRVVTGRIKDRRIKTPVRTGGRCDMAIILRDVAAEAIALYGCAGTSGLYN